MARTSANPKLHRVTVRLTDDEQRALEIIRKAGGHRYLNDALRSLIPRVQLGPAEMPAADAQALVASKTRRRRS